MVRLDRQLKKVPFFWRYADHLRPRFPGSIAYWENRYSSGGNSGVGSYGHLADYKAAIINEFVAEFRISSVVEFGCGDGNQLSLAEYPRYLGLDVSRKAIEANIQRFKGDCSKSFLLYEPACFNDASHFISAELGLSLDVIYHLIEDKNFHAHIMHLFGTATRFVIIYSSNHDEIVKNSHVRHRRFAEFVERECPLWQLMKVTKNRYSVAEFDSERGSFSDFYIYEKRAP